MRRIEGTWLKNRYRVDELIGRGGMAEVYKVWDSKKAVYLAMKLLHDDLAEDRIFLRRFTREANTLNELQHPHIVRFYGLEHEGRMAFMLMEYVEGRSLRSEVFDANGRPFSHERIREVMQPICSALHYAHNTGRVHCDIKPANIMLNRFGQVMLADFGIARMTDTATATMVGAGTPAYMAPEQIRGKDPTPQTDLYALGIVLFEMLTGGERPFTGENAGTTGSTSEKVRWEQLNLQPPSPRKWNRGISPQLEAVVMKCLEKNPARRYRSALEFLNALELALGGQVEPVVATPEAETVESEPSETIRQPAPIPDPAPPAPAAQVEKPKLRLPAWGWAAIGVLMLVLAMWSLSGLGGETSTPADPDEILVTGEPAISQEDQINLIYTQAAETLQAEIALTEAAQPEPTDTPIGSSLEDFIDSTIFNIITSGEVMLKDGDSFDFVGLPPI